MGTTLREEVQLGEEMKQEKLQELNGTVDNKKHLEEIKKGKATLAWRKRNKQKREII